MNASPDRASASVTPEASSSARASRAVADALAPVPPPSGAWRAAIEAMHTARCGECTRSRAMAASMIDVGSEPSRAVTVRIRPMAPWASVSSSAAELTAALSSS